MDPVLHEHAFTLDCLLAPNRHAHDFRVPDRLPQRCRCSHTRFTINTGGPLPPVVTCQKCKSEHRFAAAWLAGVTAGVTWTTRKAAVPL